MRHTAHNSWKWWPSVAFAGILVTCLVLAGSITTASARAATGAVTQFFVGGIPADITAGADGNVWFPDYISNEIVKMTPAGVTTRYSIPTFFSLPSSITSGADGNVWFTEVNGNMIGRITPAGVITEFAVPTPAAGLYGGITLGSDGNVWFAEGNSGSLGRITPAGSITEFPGIGGYDVASGPDGNLWTVNPFSTAIGRLTTGGTATFFFPPISGGTGGAITGGPDGNVWFTYIANGGQVGKMTTSGTFVAGYPIPTNTSSLAITGGPDGNVWFGEWDYAKVGQITPTGVVTEYPVGGARISGITTGPDGNVWFASRDGWVGRIEVAAPDTTAPTITVPDDISADATSPSGAVVTYSVSATDADDAVASLTCTPASGTTFPIGTRTVTCTATDTHENSSTARFNVHVEGAAEQLVDLLTAVSGIGPGRSLGDKVNRAQDYLAANEVADACSTLDAFVKEVTAQAGAKLLGSQAATLIAAAQQIEAVIGC